MLTPTAGTPCTVFKSRLNIKTPGDPSDRFVTSLPGKCYVAIWRFELLTETNNLLFCSDHFAIIRMKLSHTNNIILKTLETKPK